MEKYTLEGVFWEKKIHLEQYLHYWNDNIVINIHGAFWKTNPKYQKFANDIYKTGKSSVILADSSRIHLGKEWGNLSEFELKQLAFTWKLIKDEIKDFAIVLEHILSNSEKLVGIEREKLNVILNGNSLWWIISFYLWCRYNQIKAISLVWTWARLAESWTTLLDSWPDILSLKKVCEWFKWKVLLSYWTEDFIFSEDAFRDLYSFLWKPKSFVKYFWVDHSFKKINGIKSRIPYDYITQSVLHILDWKLDSWEVFLSNETEGKSERKVFDDLKNSDLLKNDEDWFWE